MLKSLKIACLLPGFYFKACESQPNKFFFFMETWLPNQFIQHKPKYWIHSWKETHLPYLGIIIKIKTLIPLYEGNQHIILKILSVHLHVQCQPFHTSLWRLPSTMKILKNLNYMGHSVISQFFPFCQLCLTSGHQGMLTVLLVTLGQKKLLANT